jgi:hypothetical protein
VVFSGFSEAFEFYLDVNAETKARDFTAEEANGEGGEEESGDDV